MTDVTWDDKQTGDQFTADEANETKAAINSKSDEDHTHVLADVSDADEASSGTVYADGLQAVHDAGGAPAAAANATIALMAADGGEQVPPAEDTDHWENTEGLIIATPQSLNEAEAVVTITPSAGLATFDGSDGWNFAMTMSAATDVDTFSGLTRKVRTLLATASGADRAASFSGADFLIGFSSSVTVASGKVAKFEVWGDDATNVHVQYLGQQDATGGISAATTTEVLTGTATTVGVTPDALAALWEQGSNITAAGTISIGEGGYFTVTGNTGITDIDFATDKAGRIAVLYFTGTPSITHSATLVLPGAANHQVVAGDVLTFVSEGSDTVRCISVRPNGLTGTGSAVRATTPTLVTPVLGVATATSINGMTFTAASGSGGSSIKFLEDTDGGSNGVTLQGPDSTADVTVKLPAVAGDLVVAADVSATNTGTATTSGVTPDALAGSNFGIKEVMIPVFYGNVDVVTGDGAAYFHCPPSMNGMNLVYAGARVVTAGTTGTTDIQIANVTDAVDVLSTKITIDSTELTGGTSNFQGTAAAAAVINASNDDIATHDLWRIDVDATSTTKAKGLIVTLGFQLP